MIVLSNRHIIIKRNELETAIRELLRTIKKDFVVYDEKCSFEGSFFEYYSFEKVFSIMTMGKDALHYAATKSDRDIWLGTVQQ